MRLEIRERCWRAIYSNNLKALTKSRRCDRPVGEITTKDPWRACQSAEVADITREPRDKSDDRLRFYSVYAFTRSTQ